jgi:hypothetical protein
VTSALIELDVLIDDDTYILGVDNDDDK